MSEWVLEYEGFEPAQEGLREALCTLGNGYFATRGAAPEAVADGTHYPGTYVAGCYNRLTSEVAGQRLEHESLVNVPNWLPLSFRAEGSEWFDPERVELVSYRQGLDVRRGTLTRSLRYRDGQGRVTRVTQRRFVHMEQEHLAGLETEFVAENWSGYMEVCSAIDGRVANTGIPRYRGLASQHLVPLESAAVALDTVYLQAHTSWSRVHIAEAARTRIVPEEAASAERRTVEEPGYIGQVFNVRLERARPVQVEKVVALFTSRDRAVSECGLEARNAVARALPFDQLLEQHAVTWNHLWRRCRLTIEADEQVALAPHVHIFHLLQTVSENSLGLDAGVPARGLHGEAYRGHVFWDELFIFPFLNLRLPEITRAVLLYRYRRLPEARQAAREAGFAGAMYPWQSSSNGREESQTMHLNPRSGRWLPDNSSLQRHIGIAVAYNVWHYYQVSGDVDFLSFYGAEIILEIARFFSSLAEYNESLEQYEIRRVMGPDEYHDAYPWSDRPGLDNNAYTNIMAVWVVCRALEVLDLLPAGRRDALWDRLGLSEKELERWERISRRMRVVFQKHGIISQFEEYGRLEEFDWQGYRQRYGDIQRLDRILEAEEDTPNRYKASKQADVLMLFYLLSARELRELLERLGYDIDQEMIPRTIHYYLQRTSHGSTLSRIVHSWVLARYNPAVSWQFFRDALDSDISDVQGGTTSEGIHLGAMAGTLDLAQRCYTGLETRGDVLRLDPSLPAEVAQLDFTLRYRQQRVDLQVNHRIVRVSGRGGGGAPVRVAVRGETAEIHSGESHEFRLAGG